MAEKTAYDEVVVLTEARGPAGDLPISRREMERKPFNPQAAELTVDGLRPEAKGVVALIEVDPFFGRRHHCHSNEGFTQRGRRSPQGL